ncbi:S58 family peptidase, partial [Candidatus Acetothermia bacterium]
AGLGLARTGARGHSGSGDFVIAFSTANLVPHSSSSPFLTEIRLNDAAGAIDLAFQGAIEAVEESIVSALFHAHPVTGRDGHTREALPIARVLELLRSRGVLIQPGD